LFSAMLRQMWSVENGSSATSFMLMVLEEYLGPLSGFWWFNDPHLSR
jgi:hypothetical protein